MSDLVLWDIDLTLIETGGIGREVYTAVLREMTGAEPVALPSMHGRTELAIVDDALRTHDLAADPDDAHRVLAALGREFRRRRDDLRARAALLPGVARALAHVDGRDGAIQSLVTGNTRAVARLKLEAAGIDGHFRWSCGAFGDEHRERSRLVRLARERAGAEGGPVDRVVVVGDTPYDVAAARAEGAHAIGVATGRFSAADLRAAGADAVLDDLSATDRFAAALDAA